MSDRKNSIQFSICLFLDWLVCMIHVSISVSFTPHRRRSRYHVIFLLIEWTCGPFINWIMLFDYVYAYYNKLNCWFGFSIHPIALITIISYAIRTLVPALPVNAYIGQLKQSETKTKKWRINVHLLNPWTDRIFIRFVMHRMRPLYMKNVNISKW